MQDIEDCGDVGRLKLDLSHNARIYIVACATNRSIPNFS